jgi:CheY-like chemotaxis protein
MSNSLKKILVVEDNPESLYLVLFLLENAGYEVIVASNGLDAVHLCQEALPDLIVMDIQLPVMDGYEATRQLKLIPETAHIPIVAFTAYAMASDIDKALKAGCVGHMTKPMNVKTFVHEIKGFWNA